MVRRQATIADVARTAGVSRQTVSRVVNNKGEISAQTRQRIRAIIEELGYRPHVIASSLAGGRSRHIGLVITNPAEEVPTNPFFLSVIYGASTEAEKREYGLVIRYAPADEVIRLRENVFGRGQVDGIVVLRAHRDCAAAFGGRGPDQLPVVLVGDFPPDCQCPFVDIDNTSGGHLLAEHLLEHGYRRIAVVCHSPAGHASADRRVQALLDAFRLRDLPVAREAILWTDSTLPDAYRKALTVVRGCRPPQAIVATNDWTAMVVLRAIHDTGLRVPEDVAVVGFDDLPLAAYLEPPLTTVVFSGFDLGRSALERLICRIETGAPAGSAHLPARLVIRRSCGCPLQPPLEPDPFGPVELSLSGERRGAELLPLASDGLPVAPGSWPAPEARSSPGQRSIGNV
ncbi:MAG: LacI family DNA-binding transcriptional regulator [Chloroflexi bacterium]|nr:LacI family DNA-binding transcriptional regulator [Chloroflexota bacterium]